MPTSVQLMVTPAEPIDPDRYAGEVPKDIAVALRAVGQAAAAALVQRGGGPVRLMFRLGGRDRLAASEQLVDQLTRLGYEVDVSVMP